MGAKWSVERPADPTASSTSVRIECTLAGEEKAASRNAWRIAAKGGETGESKRTVEATFWIDKATGETLRVHSSIKDVAFPGDGGHVDAETDAVRTDVSNPR